MTTDSTHTQQRSQSTASIASSSASFHTDLLNRSHSPDPSTSSGNKVIGACFSCRRSKVKCEHDGTAPCKRCKNGGYECTFKPREMGSAFLQDEWRIKTDETLSKLVNAIGALVQKQEGMESGVGPGIGRKRKADGEVEEGEGRYTCVGANGRSMVASSSQSGTSKPIGGHGDAGTHAMIGSHLQPSKSTSRYQPAPSSTAFTPKLEAYLGNTSRRSSGSFAMDQTVNFSASAHALPSLTSVSGIDAISLARSEATSSVESNNPIRAALKARSSLPLPSITTITASTTINSAPGISLVARPSRYRHPDPALGSADPRLDALRLGLLSSHVARSLFTLYSKQIEPFSFGFPDFPSSPHLTPVLLSSITSVSSLLSPSPSIRTLHLRLRSDFLDRTLPYAPLSPTDEFNPESGIGTEEVIGACIFSTHDPSHQGWQVARSARWWSEKYSYEAGPHAGLTVGEMVAILPPVRHVNIQDRVRVWLSAFIAELHQCEMHGREAIMEAVSPCSYAQSLQLEAGGGSKQDACLVFYARIAYLIAKARETAGGGGGVKELTELAEQTTKSWYETRTLLGTEPDRRDVYDSMVDLHYSLAKRSVLIRACRACEEAKTHGDTASAVADLVSCTQACQAVCMDSIRLLLTPKAGLLGNLAALPAIYHFWIAGCCMFLVQLCSPERMHYRLGLLREGEVEEVLRVVSAFLEQYVAEVDAISTRIVLEGKEGEEVEEEVMKHPAMEAALVVREMLAAVQATA